MAEIDFREGAAFGGTLQRMQRLVNLLGALTSVTLVAGLAYWGHQLAVRDVSGVPVVRALAGPMRVAPADPGGEVAGNMGLSVNAIAAEGEEQPPADRLVLAPRPVELAPEDLPAAALPAAAVAPPLAAVADPNPSGVLGTVEVAGNGFTPRPPVEVPTETQPLTAAALVEAALLPPPDAVPTAVAVPAAADPDLLVAPGEPILLEGLIEPAAPAEVPEDGVPPTAEVAEAPAPTPPGALQRSPRPLARPSEMVVLAAASASAPAPTVARSADAAAIRRGTLLVQLGAFDGETDAIAEWNRLTVQFGALLADKARVLQPAHSGGRDFVRLRAMGFGDDADARRFCAALLAEGAACIPVAQR
jgi:hypothetical protein